MLVLLAVRVGAIKAGSIMSSDVCHQGMCQGEFTVVDSRIFSCAAFGLRRETASPAGRFRVGSLWHRISQNKLNNVI